MQIVMDFKCANFSAPPSLRIRKAIWSSYNVALVNAKAD
jgi:hypothetical protein